MADDGLQVYFAKFGLDASEFLNGLSKSSGGILQFYRDVSVSLGATMFVFDKLMAYGQQFIALANQAAEFVSVIDKLSVTTGMTNEELQRFANVARYADSDISSLAQMVNKLQINLNDQGESGEKTRKVLDAMRVSYKNVDGSLRDANALFPDVIEGLKGVGSSADRVTAANILVGKGYQELAGYIALGKDGIERYYASANTLTDEQQTKLRNYETACKDLNATLQNINFTVGSQLAPSFDLLAQRIDKAFGNANTPASKALDFLVQRLDEVAFLVEGTATKFSIMMGEGTPEEKDAKWAQWIQDYKDTWAAINDTPFDAYADAQKRFGIGGGTKLPSLSTDKNALSETDIKKVQNDLSDLTNYTIPKQRDEVKRLEKAYKELGDKSSQAAKDAKREWEHALNALDGYLIQQQEYSDKLSKAGAPSSTGGSTYNELFASSLNTGGVGPDYAGFSDLANMSQSELEKIAAGGLGKSKAMAERAQQYLSMMKSGTLGTASTSSGTAAKKDLTPGSADQTKAVESEYNSQTKALESLTDKTVKEYQKQSDAFKKYMEDLATFRTEQYPVLEKLDLIHWATSEEIAKVAAQKELDFMAACVNFGGKNPIIQNYIVMGKYGPDWHPPAFQAVTAPTLESADFTQVGAAVQGIVNKGLGEGTSATANLKATIVVEDKTANGIKATNAKTKANSRALAGVTGIGGTN